MYRDKRLTPFFRGNIAIYADEAPDMHYNYLFPAHVPIVIVGSHSDDAARFGGVTFRKISRTNPLAMLVICVNDEEGISGEYANACCRTNPGLLRNQKFLPEDPAERLKAIKRFIRETEFGLNADGLGYPEGRRLNLDLRLPHVSRAYNSEGRFLSYDSGFAMPPDVDREKINSLVREYRGAIFFMAHPQSRHSQNKIATALILNAIQEYSPESRIYFWSSLEEKMILSPHDNLIVYFSDNQLWENERVIRFANDSQNLRHGDPSYYSKMYREQAEYVRAENMLQSRNRLYAESFRAMKFT
jgi:hypothetical protein